MNSEIKKAALYIRVSTVHQVDKDSLPMQREDLANYSKYALGINDYEIFEDAGFSAKDTDRPAFQNMMSRMRKKEFSHLVVWKIDRISRNLLDFAQMHSELKRLGVTFVSKNEQFDTSTAMGEAMLKIILVFAELERKMTSERVTSVMISRAQKGLWNGGPAPYGYNYDPASKTLSINESEAEVVKRIFQSYNATPSSLAISRALNREGAKTRNNGLWTSSYVASILHNPFYIGTYTYFKYDESTDYKKYIKRQKDDWVYVENNHEAIVDRSVFESVALKLKGNNRLLPSQKTYERKYTHILAGVLVCGKCGHNYICGVDSRRKSGLMPSLYHCPTRRRHQTCDNSSISDITIGDFLFNFISNLIRVQKTIGKSTSLDRLEKLLLGSQCFSDVKGIGREGLASLHKMYTHKKKVDFESNITGVIGQGKDKHSSEIELLLSEKSKHEKAMLRLQQLYLYADDNEAISRNDFTVQKQQISEAIEKIDARLQKLYSSEGSADFISDNFIEKASLFMLSQQMGEKNDIDFRNLLLSLDRRVLKEFVHTAISKIVILNAKVMTIQLKNGITLNFLYE